VRSDCLIRILPPGSKVSEYQRLIQELPEQEMRLGEILIKCGTLTPEELDSMLRIQAQHDQDEPQRPIGEVLVEQQLVSPPVVEAALEKQKQVKDNKKSEANLIRVDADKLDELINLVGELIIAGAGTNLIAQGAGMADLIESTATLSQLVEDVRDSALALRMVPIGATFNRFTRVVRDVSKELGKDIALVISGADTELDKTVVEKIADPLTHLVRNSMDHGIEPADVRLARGKPAQGTLKLNAYHDAGSIVIEVGDDGGGLNREKILAKAIERGLVSDGAGLSDKDIYNLIFEPGFSTADTVSNLSGRGVGMDVVRSNIQALRGTVDLDSVEGQGSTTRIRLPLTLAIIDGFMVGVGNAVYVIPLDMVVECVELGAWRHDGNGQCLNLRGEVLPYRRLRDHFVIQADAVPRENVVVVRYGEHKAGLVVDKLMGEFQTVIKPLGKLFQGEKSLGGFTILGSGEVALIVDVPGLMAQVEHEQGAAP
jgi:two-component system chemotaxis sensor kinase CheA